VAGLAKFRLLPPPGIASMSGSMSTPSPSNAPPQGAGRAYFLLTLTTACWGGNAVFGRLAVGEVSPMLLVSLRWFGVVLLLAVFANKYIRRDWPVIRANIKFLFAMGAIGFAGFNSLFYIAAHSTTAVNIGIIQGAMPALVLIGAFLFYKTPVSRLQKFGVSVTFLGVIVVGIGGDLTRLTELALNRGDLMLLFACVLYSGYTVGLRNRPETSSLGLFTALALAAFLATVPLTLTEIATDQLIWPSADGWIIVGLITLLPSFIAQITFIQGVELIGPGRAGAFINLVPMFSSIFAVSYLGETFEIFHGVALVMVLGGIWLSEKGKVA
jgi:drug/metabolite transporter (DMT)-like permease